VNFKKLEDLSYICKLLFSNYKIPITFIDDQGNILYELSQNHKSHPLFPSKIDFFRSLVEDDEFFPFPVFQSVMNIENVFYIQLPPNERLSGCIYVGPVLYSTFSDEMMHDLMEEFHLNKEKDQLVQYYQSLPVISNLHFMNMSMILYYMLFQKQLDLAEMIQMNKEVENNKIGMELVNRRFSEQQDNRKVKYDIAGEMKVYETIRAGKKGEIIQVLRELIETVEPGILSRKSHLRNQKNLAISGIALATRAAIEGGLYPEIAYTLSDFFIQNLEDLTDSNAVARLLMNAFLEFTDRVEKSNRNKYSKPIHVCQHYIFTHLYEEITLTKLAEIVAINPSYLSTLFKKEVGMSISEYVQSAKVNEAKNLLSYTSYSMSDIASLLNFYDQSHFIRVFKKYTGVTPKQFKNEVPRKSP